MKTIRKIIAVLLCLSLTVSLCSCGKDKKKESETQQNVAVTAQSHEESVSSTIQNSHPVVSDIINSDEDQVTADQISEEIDDGKVDNIRSIVSSAVEHQLTDAGFITGIGVASTTENDNYSSLGIYYQYQDFDFFSDKSMSAVGFLDVVEDTEPFFEAELEDSAILVYPVDEEADDQIRVCTFSYKEIKPSHLIYDGKYVKYYQQTGMRVVYSVEENAFENYDLSLGSLYDYDKGQFIYDETIFGEYKHHSGTQLFSNEDYDQLEKELKQFSDEQLKAGYEVTDYTVVYISPESIQAYLDSEEEDTFFGYSVNDLTEAFGLGTALEYTGDGFREIKMLDEGAGDYDWKSFLTKIGIGAGIILVGAVLAPVTGGASFGCALLTISKVAVGFALTSALGNLAIKTAQGMIEGKTVQDSLLSARDSSLDAFANGFIIGAVIGSVGVATGLIKPTACFVAGTLIAVPGINGINYKKIEDINVGDLVYSYCEESGVIEPKRVLKTYVKYADQLTSITAGEELIVTTPEHPLYDAEQKEWITAASTDNVELFTIDENSIAVTDCFTENLTDQVPVYNFTVEDYHTYFVGENAVLVHNTCDEITKLRNEGVRKAWQKEVEAVKNGTSKYNWTRKEIKELLTTGKIKGYEGHHILTVNELKNTVNQNLIADARDIVFIPAKKHLWVHGGNFMNPTDMQALTELLPWAAERYMELLALVA